MSSQVFCTAPNSLVRSDVDKFLSEMGANPAGRLIFALDATASRQPTWDMACKLQSEMFHEACGLSVQLVYYRGFDECKASRFAANPAELLRMMERLDCRSGVTQIGKILAHAKREHGVLPVAALVFVGDALEEAADPLIATAKELGVATFMFQEGDDPFVEQIFRRIAEATGGAWARFDAGAARQLAELLTAVAAFAIGGKAALEGRKDEASVRLLGQMK